MKGLKSILAFGAVCLISTTAQAGWVGNWLIGATGGYESRSGDLNMYLYDNLGAIPLTTQYRDFHDNGFAWGFLGGYQVRCNGWLFGTELNIDWHENDTTNNFAFVDSFGSSYAGSERYHRGTNVGLTLRAGHAISHAILAYIRAGAETSDDDLTVSMFEPSTQTNISGSDSRRSYRFIGGIGLEMPIILDNLTARVEYNYHGKGKRVELAAVGSDNLTLLTANSKPHANSGIVSLVWNFL